MNLFCLVHGSAQNAACWDLLAPELEKRGHRTIRPVLPTDEPQADSRRYAEVIAASIPANQDDAAVVGHSASGLFLPLVAARRRVHRLVFVAAVLPQLGMSFLDQYHANPQIVWPDWAGKDPSRDETVARQFLFHDCSPEVAAWAMSTRIRLPLERVATEIFPLPRWPDVPSSYIVCTQDRTIRPEWWRRAARERLGVQAIEIDSGHCPYLSQPAQLTGILDRSA